MGEVRVPARKKNPGKGAGIRPAGPRDSKAKAMKKHNFGGLRK